MGYVKHSSLVHAVFHMLDSLHFRHRDQLGSTASHPAGALPQSQIAPTGVIPGSGRPVENGIWEDVSYCGKFEFDMCYMLPHNTLAFQASPLVVWITCQ